MRLTQKTILLAAPAWALLVLGTGLAQAQQPSAEQTSAIRANCRSDFMSDCSGVQPGGEAALECLKQNVARLSAPCKTAVSAIMPAPPAAAEPAAAAPAAPPPSAASPAAPAPVAKPKPAARLNPVPPPPVAAAPAIAPLKVRPFIMPERRIAISAICHADAERLCSGIPAIGPALLDCLAAKAASLSPNCYDAIARVSER